MSTAMMPMTTSSSTIVNAPRRLQFDLMVGSFFVALVPYFAAPRGWRKAVSL